MSIPNPKFSYILSTKRDGRENDDIFGVEVKKGHQAVISQAVYTSGSTLGHNTNLAVIEKVDFQLGVKKLSKKINNVYEDVVLAPASGMSVQGALTYGSGKIVTSTVWATDNDLVNKGDFIIGRPKAPVVYNYNSLST